MILYWHTDCVGSMVQDPASSDVIGDGVNQDVALELPAFTCIDGLECPGSCLAWPLVFLDEGECELTIGMLWGIQVVSR